MKVEEGAYKRVLLFRNFVVKIPRNFKLSHLFSVLEEQWIYFFAPRQWTQFIIPTYGLLLIPITIQPRAETIDPFEPWVEQMEDDHIADLFEVSEDIPNYMITDIRVPNLGYYKDKLVKIDVSFSRAYLSERFPKMMKILEVLNGDSRRENSIPVSGEIMQRNIERAIQFRKSLEN